MTRRPEPERLVFLSDEQYRERFGRDPEPPEVSTEPWPYPGAWLGWTQPWAPPTVVVVMAEHGDIFLWNRSPERDPWGDSYTLDPAVLGLNDLLAGRLLAWNARYAVESTSVAWVDEGRTLAHDVQREFDARGLDVEVLHHEPDGSEPAVRGRRR